MITAGGWSPTVRVDRYSVSMLPRDHEDASSYDLAVEYRGGGLWAVVRGRRCLGVDGSWSHEPHSSERDDEWLAAHRFPEREAIELAVRTAPGIRAGGITAAEAAARDLARATGRTNQTEATT